MEAHSREVSSRHSQLPEPFRNGAGVIQNLVDKGPFEGVAIIESRAGSVRSNHYHRTDWHYLYLVSGQMLYWERDVGATELPEPLVVRAGQMVFTPPLREHACKFLADTTMVSISRLGRDHEAHEADLVRLETPMVVEG